MDDRVNPPDSSPTALPPHWRPLLDRSIELVRTTQHPTGAWPAAPAFAPYRFSWFRDGSFIAEGASVAGLHGEADRFHRWCAAVLDREAAGVESVLDALARGEEPEDEHYLPARYTLDGERSDDGWWNFQVDGYGTWLWALERHLGRTGGDATPFRTAVTTAVRYLVATGRGPCRDWWEENRDHTHVATLAGVAAGLRAAVRLGLLADGLGRDAAEVAAAAEQDIRTRGVRAGHLVKWLDGDAVDGSLLSVAALYDVLSVDDPVIAETVRLVEERLTDGGVHRYEADTFYGGGQWPVLACLLARHHDRIGNHDRATELLDWVVRTADDDLHLPEQVPPLRAPDTLAEWLDRWGPSARPLVWSHGMFLAAILDRGLGAPRS